MAQDSHSVASQGWTKGRSLKPTHVAGGKPQDVARYWLQTSVPVVRTLHRASHSMASDFPQGKGSGRDNERKTMREPVRWKSQSLCNLIAEETPHHFCWILFFRSESWCLAHTQGLWGHKFHKARILEADLQAAYHSIFCTEGTCHTFLIAWELPKISGRMAFEPTVFSINISRLLIKFEAFNL